MLKFNKNSSLKDLDKSPRVKLLQEVLQEVLPRAKLLQDMAR
jgi:hypothetical protein